MELLDSVAQKCPEAVSDKDQVLRDHFADNVRDSMLRKELRKAIREHPSVKFFEIREEAIRWSEEEEKPIGKSKSACSSEVSAPLAPVDADVESMSGKSNNVLAEILKTMQDQQKSILDLTSAIKGMNSKKGNTRKPLKFTDDGKPICYRCDQPGHVGMNCPQKKKPTGKSSDESQLNPKPLS